LDIAVRKLSRYFRLICDVAFGEWFQFKTATFGSSFGHLRSSYLVGQASDLLD